ncbi:hypothetical protein KC332_g13072 [Hortaea werneckii]|uniref:Peptidase M48 domain-containing protein n=2 Tax=Hortaea werneckii TaxID=91943 RepID=A0A3M7HHP6_HORWE|nr:hypothetical protein KC350_g13757 [Hortaea werneckii]OTA24274.1 hypothetical protein BTJ68_13035 [Hortaea werneckii EXF-2000]KAI6809339.1 hypothetical protein KC358_g12674 [Hortaea werneckii]KAI6917135.1 hypothetical protein KC348_g11269 [Hortaea werneckii]KAI6937576.1 hypothetical protein KC341_g5463 [Hortaea werneckii]
MSATRALTLTTGLLSLTKSDDELAVVVGHELAHAVAGHSREEALTGKHTMLLLLPWLPAVIPGQAMMRVAAGVSPIFHLPAFVLASPLEAMRYWKLRKSRAHEREADYMGLMLMCEAGYDPAAAVTHWVEMDSREQEQLSRLQAKYGRGRVQLPNEWASTHPHSTTRIAELQTLIPHVRAMVEQGKRLQQQQKEGSTFLLPPPPLPANYFPDRKDSRRFQSWLAFLRSRHEGGAKEMVPLRLAAVVTVRIQCLDG